MPSTAIKFYRYDASKRTLLIVFTSGRRYLYAEVPPDIAAAFDAAESKGAYFNADIRDRYAYREITR